MINLLFYSLIFIQLGVLFSKLLISGLSFIQPFFAVIIGLAISLFVIFILYVANAGKLFLFLTTVFLSFIVARFGNFYNIIPFAALYLYIISLLTERHIFSVKNAIILSPIIAIGMIPMHWPGIFESNIGGKIHAFLYSTGSSSAHGGGGKSTAIISYGIPHNSTAILANGAKETFNKMHSFEALLIISVLLIGLIIIGLFIVGFYRSTKKSVFYKSLISSLVIGVITIAIVSISFFKIFMVNYKKVVSSLISKGGANGKLPSDIPHGNESVDFIIKRVVSSTHFLDVVHRFSVYSGIILGIITVVLGVLLIRIVYDFIFEKSVPDTIIGGDTASRFRKQIKDKGIRKSLLEYGSDKEFVKFFYFSVLYLLAKRDFKINKYETPNEFYERLLKKSETAIPYFDLLTALFNKVKYSDEEIFESEIFVLKNHSEELISAVENVRFKEKHSGKGELNSQT